MLYCKKKMLTGLTRLDIRKDIREPITYPILVKIVQTLPCICYTKYETILFTAIFVLAFFGFMRIGELVQDSEANVGHALQYDDVKIVNDSIEIRIKHSKTDQTGKGVIICVTASGKGVCPVKCIIEYEKIRPKIKKSYFCHFSGKYVTRYQVTSVLKKTLDVSLAKSALYKSHSFRIGAATSAAMAGASDEDIAKMGRWKSSAYKNYIRIPSTSIIF